MAQSKSLGVDIESISSFDIKCKNSIMGVVPFSIFVDHVRIFSSGTMQHLRWSSLSQKKVTAGNWC